MATISGEIHQFKNKAGTKNWWPRTVTEAIYGLDSTIADVKTWVGNNYQAKYAFTISGTSGATYNLATIATQAANGNSAYSSLSSYLPLTGGTLSGDVTTNANIYLLGTNSYSAIVKKLTVTSGGWARNFLKISNNSDETIWALSAFGGDQGLIYMYLGSSEWNSDNNIRFYNSGTVRANTFQKVGGTSSQFLKADGSVDSNTYLTTSAAASTYLPLTGGKMTGPLTWKGTTALPENTSAVYFLTIDAFTAGGTTKWASADTVKTSLGLANYLPLAGGTLTGNLAMADGKTISLTKYSNRNLIFDAAGISFVTSEVTTGAWANTLLGVRDGNGYYEAIGAFGSSVDNVSTLTRFYYGGTYSSPIASIEYTGNVGFKIWKSLDITPFADNSCIIGASDKAYKEVYSHSFIKPGGTSSQFLKANGSVETLKYSYSLAANSAVKIIFTSSNYSCIISTRFTRYSTSLFLIGNGHGNANVRNNFYQLSPATAAVGWRYISGEGIEITNLNDIPLAITVSMLENNATTVSFTESTYDATSAFANVANAFVDSNVASATKLQTARSIWGHSFDGTTDITGDLTNVSSIEFSGVSSAASHGGYLDFHYNGSTADYTSRIIESASGMLSLNGQLHVHLGGNVGIGTTSPSHKLDVVGDMRVIATGSEFAKFLVYQTNPYGIVFSSEASGTMKIQARREASAQYFNLALNPLGGNVGIGTGSPAYKLDVSGVIYSTVGIFSNGYVSALGTASSSDAKLKDDITTISYDRAKEVLSALNPSEWTWNALTSKEGERGAGMVAQEVESILPDTVKEIGGNLTLEYNTLFAYGLAMTKYLVPAVESLEERVARLERENEELKRQLTN